MGFLKQQVGCRLCETEGSALEVMGTQTYFWKRCGGLWHLVTEIPPLKLPWTADASLWLAALPPRNLELLPCPQCCSDLHSLPFLLEGELLTPRLWPLQTQPQSSGTVGPGTLLLVQFILTYVPCLFVCFLVLPQ